jgi:hypothetical protein
MVDRSPLRRLVERELRQDVCAWVAERRKANPAAGVRPLARELYALTGVQVNPTTLHRWCPQLPD